jgi:hypothetical protein
MLLLALELQFSQFLDTLYDVRIKKALSLRDTTAKANNHHEHFDKSTYKGRKEA